MIPALIALAVGGVLARTVLWPLETALQRRHVRRVTYGIAALERDLDQYREQQQ